MYSPAHLPSLAVLQPALWFVELARAIGQSGSFHLSFGVEMA